MKSMTPRSRRWASRLVATPALAAVLLTACGGSTAVESNAGSAAADATDPVAAAAQAAEANMANLQSADSAFDVEVLDVADGSISTLRDAVSGDRPVLVWFFSPH